MTRLCCVGEESGRLGRPKQTRPGCRWWCENKKTSMFGEGMKIESEMGRPLAISAPHPTEIWGMASSKSEHWLLTWPAWRCEHGIFKEGAALRRVDVADETRRKVLRETGQRWDTADRALGTLRSSVTLWPGVITSYCTASNYSWRAIRGHLIETQHKSFKVSQGVTRIHYGRRSVIHDVASRKGHFVTKYFSMIRRSN